MLRVLSCLCLLNVAAPPSLAFAFVSLIPKEGWAGQEWRAWEEVEAILRQTTEARCSAALLTDAHTPSPPLLQVRKRSWCLTVVVLVTATCPSFLAPLAEACMAARLLAGDTRLLLLLRGATYSSLAPLLAPHWPFTMATTLVLNMQGASQDSRATLYLYRPYTSEGPSLVRVKEWRGKPPTLNSTFLHRLHLLQDKFSDFHGAEVKVTAKPFPPYWLEGEEERGAGDGYHGTDYLLLQAVASTLNFSVAVVPTSDWNEVTEKVEKREAFMATIIYAVLPDRLKRYSFSYPYEYASPTFCMTKPLLRPQFLSLYYPLTNEVWLSILLALVLVPLVLVKMTSWLRDDPSSGQTSPLVDEVVRTLLGQNLTVGCRSMGTRARLVLGAWLIFALVIGAAYRGNLTAFLTIPKYPPRPETLPQLVEVVDRVTMPPYGAQFRDFYSQSDSYVFKALAQRMDLVGSAEEGLRQASDKQAHIQVRRYLELVIAESFTLRDGSTRLYLGKEGVFPGLSAWPMPHDAPFKPRVDRCIMAVKEAGLYEKWSRDVMAEARKRGKRKPEEKEEEREKKEEKSAGDSPFKALSVNHLQGPLFLLLMGLLLASLLFFVEVLTRKLLK
ncbi:ionotropic receptor 93a-like isoform X2 [Scylla paramamosain]|uniref:ionotropic receptor 93a-like isoform X2 n=1 Tax=Scylla paramamosain TaxID=85552 RepID=UPI00308298C9